MSISAPRYVQGPLGRVGRSLRTWAIFQREFRRRSSAGPLFGLALTWLVVLLVVTLNVYFASLTGGSVKAAFESPYESVFWTLLILIVAATVGAGSLADDIGSRAITLYLVRPIHLGDYLLAKGGATGSWILLATVGPGCVAVGVTAALGLVSGAAALAAVGGCLAVGLMTTIFFTGVTLTLSSLTRQSLYAGVAIFGTVLSVAVSASVVASITGNTNLLYADPSTDIQLVAEAVFGLASSSSFDPTVAGSVLVLTGAALAVLAGWRLTRIEVVGE